MSWKETALYNVVYVPSLRGGGASKHLRQGHSNVEDSANRWLRQFAGRKWPNGEKWGRAEKGAEARETWKGSAGGMNRGESLRC